MSTRVADAKNDGDTGSNIAKSSGDDLFAVHINGSQPVVLSFVQKSQNRNFAPFGPISRHEACQYRSRSWKDELSVSSDQQDNDYREVIPFREQQCLFRSLFGLHLAVR